MKYISMFSGIEAATVASNHLGWEPVAFSEIEPFPCSVLAHHYPHVPNVGDMTKVDWRKYHGTVDLVCGGSPCQAFSIAGLRQSLDDDRGNLTLEFMRACHAIKPRYIMWENVPGVFSAKGNPFGCFLAGLCGYDTAVEPVGGKWSSSGFLRAANAEWYNCAWRVLDAQYFGVPQRRQRIFLVASLGEDWWAPCEILLERHSMRGNTAESGEAREETAGDVGAGTEGAVYGIRGNHIGRKPENGGNATEPMYGLIPALTATDVHGVCSIQGNLIGRDAGGPCGVGVAENAPMYTLTSADQHAVAFHPTQDPINRVNVSHALGCGSKSGQGTVGINYGTVVRRLTPLECERLMGFPDGYTDVPHKGKPASDAPRYKALGNSWAVPCARWIFERMEKYQNG